MVRRQLVTGLFVTICLMVLLCGVYPLAVWGAGRVAFGHQADGSPVRVGGKVVGSALIGQSFSDKDGNPMPRYFQPRPSSAGAGYDPTSSSGSNLGPSNLRLIGNGNGNGNGNGAGNGAGHPGPNPYGTTADPYCVPVPATDAENAPSTDAQGNPVYEKNPDGTYACDPNTVPERVIAYRSFNGLALDAPVPVDAVTASGSGLDPDISEANALDQARRVAQARHLGTAQVVALVHQHTRGRAWVILGEKTVNVLDINVALDRLSPSG